MTKLLAISAVLTLMVPGAYAQGTAPASSAPVEMKSTGPGKAAATRSETLTAKVTAVDVANRTVTLQGKSGKPQTFSVGPQVTRLNEVAAGDTVVVEYQEGLMLELQPAGAEPVQPHGVAAASRSEQAPGGAAVASIQGTVTVTSIDMAHRLVAFEGPNGNLYQVKAGPNIKLEKLKVGDKLLATYTQALAITLAKATKK